MIWSYLLTFCRFFIGGVFIWSFLTKVKNVNQFAQTITDFKLLPNQLSHMVAIFLLISEFAVVFLILMGNQFLTVAFGLAILLLLLFTVAMAWTLAKKIQTSCNCFGSREQLVAAHDSWRNVVLVICAVGGWTINHFYVELVSSPLKWFEWSTIATFSLICVILIINFREMVAIIQSISRVS